MRELRRALLLSVLVMFGMTSVGGALAASAPAPVVATAPASGLSSNQATLNGTVDPNGQSTQLAFQWGPTSGYGHETAINPAGAGMSASPYSAVLTGLAPGSTYHFRIIAFNAGGTSVGLDATFTTMGKAPKALPAPTAVTGSANSVTGSSATLTGTVNPDGQATEYYFEYGPSADYGYESPATSVGSGTKSVSAASTLTGLPPSLTYHYRLVAISAGGTALGADATFATETPPKVATGSASNLGTASATLNGIVNPNGVPTQYYFQFGTSALYGLQTPPAAAGSSTASVAVHSSVSALVDHTVYHYRIVAVSLGGTSYGTDRTFRTGATSQAPSRVGLLGRMGYVSPSHRAAVVLGCFSGQTPCAGHLTLLHGRTVIGQLGFRIGAQSGATENIVLNRAGIRLFGRSYPGPVAATLRLLSINGQRFSLAMHLARWR
ncbi:MAG: hypothetical protein ACYC91_12760 [Solirubrobacteraceae bacterium]